MSRYDKAAIKKPTLAASMTAFPYTVDVEISLTQARIMMAEHHIRHLPVMEEGALIGVISDRDIKLGMAVSAGLKSDIGVSVVGDVYSARVYQVDIQPPLEQVATGIYEGHIGSAVVTRHGKVVGMFTASDACRCLAALLQEPTPPEDDVA